MSALLRKARVEAPRVGKFLTVGASGVVVNSAVLLFVSAHLPVLLASAIASEVAIITGYVGHELWTFRQENDGLSLRRLRKYNGVALVGLVITAVTLQALVAATEVPLLIANLIAIAAATAWNFTLSHRWAFRPSGPPTTERGTG